MFFSPFRLDADNECVWKGSEQRRLKHKSFAVLKHLAQHAGRLVSKEDLFETVWPETHVGDAVLKVCIGEIRKALDDSIAQPRYIETAHRRGYRFIAPVTENETPQLPRQSRVVERESAFFQLHCALTDVKQGRRQLVFVTGEPGIGKTTLVDSFAEQISHDPACSIAYGQCVDHHGAGESYFPVLDALSRLCRQPGKQWFVDKLRRHAPTCLAQLPALISEADREALKREVVGAAKDRMMREMAEALEASTTESPLVLILEDLHWADHSTIDLLAHLARRKERACLLLVATYRPADLIVQGHPLRSLTRELKVRGACSEIELDFLSEDAIGHYITHQYPGLDASQLASLIRQRTDGNPLFMVNILEFISSKGELSEAAGKWELTVPPERAALGIPASLRQLIEKQVELLDGKTYRLLQVASVRGREFSTREIGHIANLPAEEVESCFDELARERQFIEKSRAAEWPDGVVAEAYRFVHALYREVLYDGASLTHRIQTHKAMAGFLETHYLNPASDMASELAIHFEGGRDYLRAVYYLQEAAGIAAKRFANVEAIRHLRDALTLLARVPHADRAEPEAAVLDQLGLVYQSAGDAKSAINSFEQCLLASRRIGRCDLETNALLRLSGVLFWTDHHRSLETAERAVQVSMEGPDRGWYWQARGHYAARRIRLQGWERNLFEDCTQALRSARQMGDKELVGLHLMSYSFFLSYQSEYEQACKAADEGSELAIENGNAYQYISCQYFKSWALLHGGRWGEALRLVNQGITLSEKNGHKTGIAFFRLMKAWLSVHAFQFREASELTQQAIGSSPDGFSAFLGLIIAGTSFTGSGEHQLAAECFAQVQERKAKGLYRLDWIFHLPFYLGLADLHLAQNWGPKARNSANELLAAASNSNEQTYMAIAHQLLAEVALAEGDMQDAAQHIDDAFTLIRRRELPLAEWRVNSTAAKFAARRGDRHLHDRYTAGSIKVLSKLANSIQECQPLRDSILRRLPQAATLSRL